MTLEQRLHHGITELGLVLSPDADSKLLEFLRLLAKWNRTYNLTAVRDPEQMVTRHLLDSLAVLTYLQGPRVLDVGTGAGLPGVPLAVARPDLAFTLLDANAKKTRFVTQAVGELRLKNVEVVQARAENYRPSQKFDTLVSRAFASIADMLECTRHLCAPHARILAMKGVHPVEELAAVAAEYASEVVMLKIPGLQAERHLAVLTARL
jgi:16S rRNA (guanine527-N7)-methyltransferase